jgi:hypothetical protein
VDAASSSAGERGAASAAAPTAPASSHRPQSTEGSETKPTTQNAHDDELLEVRPAQGANPLAATIADLRAAKTPEELGAKLRALAERRTRAPELPFGPRPMPSSATPPVEDAEAIALAFAPTVRKQLLGLHAWTSRDEIVEAAMDLFADDIAARGIKRATIARAVTAALMQAWDEGDAQAKVLFARAVVGSA